MSVTEQVPFSVSSSSPVSVERLAPVFLELVQRCFPRDGLQFLAWLCRLATEKQDQLFAGQRSAVAVICVENIADLVNQMGKQWSRETTIIRLQIFEALTLLTRFRQSRHTHIHLPLGSRTLDWDEILTRLAHYPSTHRKTHQQVTRIRHLLASLSASHCLAQEQPLPAPSTLILLRQTDVVTLTQGLHARLQTAQVTGSEQEHIVTWFRQVLHDHSCPQIPDTQPSSPKSLPLFPSEDMVGDVSPERRYGNHLQTSPSGVKSRQNRQKVALPQRLLVQKSPESRIDSSFFHRSEEQKENDLEFEQNRGDNDDFCSESRPDRLQHADETTRSRLCEATSIHCLDHPSPDIPLNTDQEGISHKEGSDFSPESRPDHLPSSDEPVKSRESRPDRLPSLDELAKSRESRMSVTPGVHDGSDAYDVLLAEATFLWTRLYTEEQRQTPEGPSLIWGFITRLQEHPELVRAAMINTLLQHFFPDRHGPPTDAGARWFYRTYTRYVQGNLLLSPEIASWLQTDASYTQIEEALVAEQHRQQRQWLAPVRPFASCLTASTVGETDEAQEEQAAMAPVTRRLRHRRQSSLRDNPLSSDPDLNHANPLSDNHASLPLMYTEDPLLGWSDLSGVHWWAERLHEHPSTPHWSISIGVTQYQRYVLHICPNEAGRDAWVWGHGRQVREFLETCREQHKHEQVIAQIW